MNFKVCDVMSRIEDATWLIVFLIFGSEYQQPLSESMSSISLQFNAFCTLVFIVTKVPGLSESKLDQSNGREFADLFNSHHCS
jgi:hypothetical protein